MEPDEGILLFLRERGIPFTLHLHRPVWTMEDCLSLGEIPWDNAGMCKNILLCDRRQTQYWLLLTLHDRPFATSLVSKKLGTSRLSFATEEKLQELLRVQRGALSPLALIYDRRMRVRIATDAALGRFEYLVFHPGVNTASVRMRAEDFFTRFLPLAGHGNTVIDCGPDPLGG